MRAKDVATHYINCPDKDTAFVEAGEAFLNDTAHLMKQRKIADGASLQRLLREQQAKWAIFCGMIGNELRSDGFRELIRLHYPELYPYFETPAGVKNEQY